MANMCVDDEGYKTAEKIRFEAVSNASTLKQLVAVAQIALNASDAVESFKKLWQVSSNGLRLEEDLHNHIKGTYWPAEVQMLEEFTQPTPQEAQAVLARRYAGRMWAPIASAFAKEIKKLECETPRYCGNAYTKRMQEMVVQRSGARANVLMLADRIAFYENEAIKEVDHERRKQAIAQRQGLFGQAASLMAQAREGFAGVNANAMGAINNAIRTLGFERVSQAQANAGFGQDPFFHQQVANRVAQQGDRSNIAMETETEAASLFANLSAAATPSTFNLQHSTGQIAARGSQPFFSSGMTGVDLETEISADSLIGGVANSGVAPE